MPDSGWKWAAMAPLWEDGTEMKWQLGQPTDSSLGVLPVVLFLHGRGESGDDNTSQMKHAKLFVEMSQPSFIIVPQCPSATRWAKPSAKDENEITVGLILAMRALNHVLVSYQKADPTRVHITGFSMGGCGVWDALARWPERFASAVPLAGVANDYALRNLALEPPAIWAFHGKHDRTFPADRSKSAIDAIKGIDGNQKQAAFLTLIESGHGISAEAFASAVSWMFKQKQTLKKHVNKASEANPSGRVARLLGEARRGAKRKVVNIKFAKMNPKQPGTDAHKRYAKYKVATSLEQAKKLGATSRDIDFDFRHGFLFHAI